MSTRRSPNPPPDEEEAAILALQEERKQAEAAAKEQKIAAENAKAAANAAAAAAAKDEGPRYALHSPPFPPSDRPNSRLPPPRKNTLALVIPFARSPRPPPPINRTKQKGEAHVVHRAEGGP